MAGFLASKVLMCFIGGTAKDLAAMLISRSSHREASTSSMVSSTASSTWALDTSTLSLGDSSGSCNLPSSVVETLAFAFVEKNSTDRSAFSIAFLARHSGPRPCESLFMSPISYLLFNRH